MNIVKCLKRLRNCWLTIWLVLAAVSFVMTVGYAAYTGATQAKRVISLDSRTSMLFSSAYMEVNGNEARQLYFTYNEEDQSPLVVTVDVRNTDRNENAVYDEDIHFDLYARLIKANGDDITETVSAGGYTVTPLGESAFQITSGTEILVGSYTLKGKTTSIKLFDVSFPVSELTDQKYGIALRAHVTDSYNDIDSISGKLVVSQNTTTLSSKWSGDYGDDTTSSKTPADYDAINYIISGNGKRKLTLTWDRSKLVIDTADMKELKSDAQGNPGTLTFDVDSDEKARYSLHFYWLNGADQTVSFDDSLIGLSYAAATGGNE